MYPYLEQIHWSARDAFITLLHSHCTWSYYEAYHHHHHHHHVSALFRLTV